MHIHEVEEGKQYKQKTHGTLILNKSRDGNDLFRTKILVNKTLGEPEIFMLTYVLTQTS